MDTLDERDGQVLSVCEVSGRKTEQEARATEAKMRNWSKKRGNRWPETGWYKLRGRKTGSQDTVNQPQSGEEGQFRRMVVRPSLFGGPRDVAGSIRAPAQAHLGVAESPPAATPPSSIPGAVPYSAERKLCVREGSTHSQTAGPPHPGRGEDEQHPPQGGRPPPVGSSHAGLQGEPGRGLARGTVGKAWMAQPGRHGRRPCGCSGVGKMV